MKFDLVTLASPAQVLEAMTDFTDRRLEIWKKTLDPKVYEVREQGDTWAVAKEGSPRSPYWVVVRYDWSDPRLIRWTELETNHGDPGEGFIRITPHGAGGSRLHVEWGAHPVRLRDKVALFVLHHTMNGVIARMWRKELDRFALA
jgi:Polyketide cyclase / dehydrase and lipid transport